MRWAIHVTDECEEWLESLSQREWLSVLPVVELLEEYGPTLRHPHSSGIATSRFPHLRELRIQHQGEPYRILYAFDPNRTAVLLIGGSKAGDDRWYKVNVPKADKLYAEYLERLKGEEATNG